MKRGVPRTPCIATNTEKFPCAPKAKNAARLYVVVMTP